MFGHKPTNLTQITQRSRPFQLHSSGLFWPLQRTCQLAPPLPLARACCPRSYSRKKVNVANPFKDVSLKVISLRYQPARQLSLYRANLLKSFLEPHIRQSLSLAFLSLDFLESSDIERVRTIYPNSIFNCILQSSKTNNNKSPILIITFKKKSQKVSASKFLTARISLL